MNILIADDERLARDRLRALVEELGAPYRVVAEAASGGEVLERCRAVPVDLVLLDIRMPGIDGLEAARELAALEPPPAIVFTTAYDQHALDAFERSASGYLIKPVRRERLREALARAQRPTRAQQPALAGDAGAARLRVSYRGGELTIPLADVIYLRAEQKYVVVRHRDGEALSEESLKELEARFGARLIRLHRNALVPRARLRGLERGSEGAMVARLDGCDERLEVSRRHLPAVRRWLRGGG